MKLKTLIASEFRRGPVAVSGTVVGLTIAAFSLLLAWFQISPAVPASPAATEVTGGRSLSVPNLLIVLAFFLAATFSGASAIRIVGRTHAFQAVVLSVLVAPLVSFLSVLVFHMAPPRQTDDKVISTASNAAFYGTVIVFIAINGFPFLKGFAQTAFDDSLVPPGSDSGKSSDSDRHSASDGLGFLGLMALLVMGWGALVGKGQSVLVDTFILASPSDAPNDRASRIDNLDSTPGPR